MVELSHLHLLKVMNATLMLMAKRIAVRLRETSFMGESNTVQRHGMSIFKQTSTTCRRSSGFLFLSFLIQAQVIISERDGVEASSFSDIYFNGRLWCRVDTKTQSQEDRLQFRIIAPSKFIRVCPPLGSKYSIILVFRCALSPSFAQVNQMKIG